MTPVHFMGREIGWFVTDRLGVCRYVSLSGIFLFGDGTWYVKGKV